MPPRVKLIDIQKLKNALVTAMQAVVKEDFIPDEVVPEIEAFINDLFNETIRNWQGGAGALAMDSSISSRMEPIPPSLTVSVNRTTFGAEIEVSVNSYIWNLLDQGREDRVTKKVEKFVPRVEQRTIPGTVVVKDDRQYRETVYVPAGTLIEGFEGRGWSEIIAQKVEAEFGRRYPFISMRFTVEDNL